MYLQYYAMTVVNNISRFRCFSRLRGFIIDVMTFAVKIKCYSISLGNYGIFGYHIETSDYFAIVVKTQNNAITRSKWK
jgi:hypothetical protein